MTPLEMIAEWRRGCSCASAESPELCAQCTRGLIDALERQLSRAVPAHCARRMMCVFGGRDFNGIAIQHTALTLLHADYKFSHLLHGNADGADILADRWARENGVQPVSCDALWTYYRALKRVRAAGIIRNTKMIELEPEFGLCCPGGKGTADMLEQFKQYMKRRPSARLWQMDSTGKFDEVFP